MVQSQPMTSNVVQNNNPYPVGQGQAASQTTHFGQGNDMFASLLPQSKLSLYQRFILWCKGVPNKRVTVSQASSNNTAITWGLGLTALVLAIGIVFRKPLSKQRTNLSWWKKETNTEKLKDQESKANSTGNEKPKDPQGDAKQRWEALREEERQREIQAQLDWETHNPVHQEPINSTANQQQITLSPEELAANLEIEDKTSIILAGGQLERVGDKEVFVYTKQSHNIQNRKIPVQGYTQIEIGQVIQIGNRLYKNVDNTGANLRQISDDAQLVDELFPFGLNNIRFQQGRLGDCIKLSMMLALLDDPTGFGTAAVLKQIRRNGDKGFIIKFGEATPIEIKCNNGLESTLDGGKMLTQKNTEWLYSDEYGLYDIKTRHVRGDLGIQLLERAYYKHIRRDYLANYSGSLPNGKIKTFSQEVQRWEKQHEDRGASGFAKMLIGEKGWEEFKINADDLTKGWKHSSPGTKQALKDFLINFADSPGQYRVRVGSLTQPPKTKFDVSAAQRLSYNHAYYLKRVEYVQGHPPIIHIINPHNGNSTTTIPLTMTEFLTHFKTISGIKVIPEQLSTN